jgi:hypothetical protein
MEKTIFCVMFHVSRVMSNRRPTPRDT